MLFGRSCAYLALLRTVKLSPALPIPLFRKVCAIRISAGLVSACQRRHTARRLSARAARWSSSHTKLSKTLSTIPTYRVYDKIARLLASAYGTCTLRGNLVQPHRAAGPSLPGSAGVRRREAPGLSIPARARSCRLGSPGHCRRVDQYHAGIFCTYGLYSLGRVDVGQESTQGRRRPTQTRDAAVNRSIISGLLDQAVAQYAREIGVQDAPPDRTA